MSDYIDVPIEEVDAELVDDSGLVPYEQEVDSATIAMKQAVAHASAQMELKWQKEKDEREKWKADDLRAITRMKIAAMVAGSMIGEGAAGVRQRADQIAAHAVEIADAVLIELEKKPIPLKRK